MVSSFPFQVKDCQTGDDGETPILTFDNGDVLETQLLVSHFSKVEPRQDWSNVRV